GQGDFAVANRLLRDRKLLSPLAKGYLALALVAMDRKGTSADVMKPVGRASLPDSDPQPSDIESQAMTAVALLSLDPASLRAKTLVETILAQRSGLRWTPEKATGPAVLAAATWLAGNKSPVAPCRVEVVVNGKPATTIDL